KYPGGRPISLAAVPWRLETGGTSMPRVRCRALLHSPSAVRTGDGPAAILLRGDPAARPAPGGPRVRRRGQARDRRPLRARPGPVGGRGPRGRGGRSPRPGPPGRRQATVEGALAHDPPREGESLLEVRTQVGGPLSVAGRLHPISHPRTRPAGRG